MNMAADIFKVRGERVLIEALLSKAEASIRRAFRRFLDDVRSGPVRRQVRIALEQDGVEVALRIVDAHVQRMGGVLTQVFQEAGGAQLAALATRLPRSAAHIAVSFDPTWPRAVEIMRSNRLSFVREFTRAQRESTRAALVDSFRTGSGPKQVARALRDSIGLTNTQMNAVANYQRLLESGDAEALSRNLRDRRFDPSVARAIDDGEPLGAARITRMVDQYRNRYLQYRGETIARTEALSTTSLAQQESMEQVIEQIGMPRGSVQRTWNATKDARTRDTHSEMDGQVRGLLESFVSPSGAQLLYPGDPAAPASERINCRCVLTYGFLPEV